MSRYKHFLRAVAGIFVLAGVLMPWPVSAAPSSSNTVSNGSLSAVTVGYGTDEPLQNGMIVGLKKGDASKVVALTPNSIKAMHGVVVPVNGATVTLSDNQVSSGQVYVATVGRYDVLVSTQNGPISPGDYITISSLSGIGMKASEQQSEVLGKAAGSFDGTSNVQGTATLESDQGHKVSVSIGRIPVDLGINHNPLATGVTGVPGFMESAASLITDKPVSPLRLYGAFIVFIVAVIVAGGLLYSGVRSGMVSIGRNPLARNRIMGGLFRVIALGLIIFIIGLGAVYLILTV